MRKLYIFLLLFCGTSSLLAQNPEKLYRDFVRPPGDSRPRVWWHWMNGNISREGLRKDLLWMDSIGIAGFHVFDAGLQTPQIVDKRLEYMTPEWKEAFNGMLDLADSLGMEVGIASSPGWSVTGGPWVGKEDAMKKVVWSETVVNGKRRFRDTLAQPPFRCGPYRTQLSHPENPHKYDYYRDIAVIAVRLNDNDRSMGELHASVSLSSGADGSGLCDGNLDTPVHIACGDEACAWALITFPQPTEIQTASIACYGDNRHIACMEYSQDGIHYEKLSDMPRSYAFVRTWSLPRTKAKYFRLRCLQPHTAMDIAEWILLPGARINMAEEKAGFYIHNNTRSFYPTPSTDEAADFKDVVDLTDRYRNGRLCWRVPEGRWKIFRFGYSLTGKENGPASPEATGLEADKLDKDAMRRYYRHYLQMYDSASGHRLGSVVSHLMIDSYEAGCQNWTPRMPEEFRSRRHYDLRRWLPVLTGQIIGSAEASERFLFDWKQTLGELLAENHYLLADEMLAPYGMKRYTESHEYGRVYLADGMEVKKKSDIPMSAFWTFGNGLYGISPRNEADVREAASVAHIYGQNICAAESFTLDGTGMGFYVLQGKRYRNGVRAYSSHPASLKSAADAAMSCGENRFVIHSSVHQPDETHRPGLTLGKYGQYFNRHETWACEARPWIDYLSRSCYLLQQGHFVADVLYYYGEDLNATARFDEDYPRIPAGYAFDYAGPGVLNDVQIKGNRLATASGMCYSALILDDEIRLMSVPVLRRIAEMAEAGILIIGDAPQQRAGSSGSDAEFKQLTDRIWHSGRANVFPFDQMDKAFSALTPDADIRCDTSADIRFVHRRTAEGDIYWIANLKPQACTADISFRTEGKRPQLWNAETGRREAVSYRMEDGRTFIHLDMDVNEAVFVMFLENTGRREDTVAPMQTTCLQEISGGWKLKFLLPDGKQTEITLDSLVSYTEMENPDLRYFSGTAIYSRDFMLDRLPAEGESLWLDLGEVKNMAAVYVNGKRLDLAWKAPYRVDIGRAVKQGENNLEIRVINSWVNRLIGDEQPETRQRNTYTSYPQYRADDPLLPSGLLGPVKLILVHP